jgi:hypothetical protein
MRSLSRSDGFSFRPGGKNIGYLRPYALTQTHNAGAASLAGDTDTILTKSGSIPFPRHHLRNAVARQLHGQRLSRL